MLLLAVDTSGKHGSIALARCCPGDGWDVIEVVPLEGGTFSAQLVPQIATLLGKHRLGKLDIGGLAVVSGPGSFTGLRIGLAVIKALGDVLAKPIAAVSLLQAMAASGQSRGRVIAVLDAGRGEVYAGEYEVDTSGAHVVSERLLGWAELMESGAGSVIVAADPGLADAARNAGLRVAGLRVEEIKLPRSDVIARLGWQKIQAGEIVSPEGLEANYLRRSSEIFSRGSS
ncbi:MAG: tRNA (adenosine(37)-N6)-threonylcarbamoyltransferase complex dimerization subunit type 1 TsaB [Terriglobales bacterium]